MTNETNPYKTPEVELSKPSAEQALTDPQVVSNNAGMQWLSQGWAGFKQQPLPWILMLVAYIAIMIVLSLIPIVSLATNVLMPIFMGGMMYAAKTADEGGVAQVTHLFEGFKTKAQPLAFVGLWYLLATIVVMLAVGAIAFVVVGMDNLGAVMAGDMSLVGPIRMLLLLAIFIVAIFPLVMAYFFAPVLVMFHDIKALDAMKLSFSACLKNILPMIIFTLVVIVLSILASIPLFLGFFILAPVATIAIYYGYKEIFVA